MTLAVVLPYRRRSTSNGATRWPEERSILFKALCGHGIEVSHDDDFIRLYHILGRMPEAKGYTLIRKRVADQCWHLFAITKGEFELMRRVSVNEYWGLASPACTEEWEMCARSVLRYRPVREGTHGVPPCRLKVPLRKETARESADQRLVRHVLESCRRRRKCVGASQLLAVPSSFGTVRDIFVRTASCVPRGGGRYKFTASL